MFNSYPFIPYLIPFNFYPLVRSLNPPFKLLLISVLFLSCLFVCFVCLCLMIDVSRRNVVRELSRARG
jgi:hypothetical protein